MLQVSAIMSATRLVSLTQALSPGLLTCLVQALALPQEFHCPQPAGQVLDLHQTCALYF